MSKLSPDFSLNSRSYCRGRAKGNPPHLFHRLTRSPMLPTSVVGTKRTWCYARLESARCQRADIEPTALQSASDLNGLAIIDAEARGVLPGMSRCEAVYVAVETRTDCGTQNVFWRVAALETMIVAISS